MTRRPRPTRQKQLTLSEWMRTPTAVASRAEVLTVAKLVALKLIQVHEQTRKYRRWYWRLWFAGKHLFRAPDVGVDVSDEPVAAASCELPPEGWVCTRAPGHEGPCAAVPVPGYGTPPTANEQVTEDGVHVTDRRSR